MDLHAWISLAVLVAAVTLFISKWIPLHATALAIPVVLAATGTLGTDTVLSGFANQAVIALGGIFILGAGLQESGVATLTARALQRVGGRSPVRTILILMFAAAVLSAFMSSAATVAVFLPATAVLARRTGIVASRLMMPLSFAAILGGTLTLIGTTPNLILGNELRIRTGTGLGMFEFARVGVPIVVVGIVYMSLFGWRLLPERTAADRLGAAQLPEEIARSYGFDKQLYRMKLVEQSGIAGKSIVEAGIGSNYLLDVVLVLKQGKRAVHPGPDLVLQAGDHFYVEGEADAAWRMADEETVQLGLAGPDELEKILGRGVTLAEVTLSPRSEVIGRTFKDLKFRNTFGLTVASIWRRGETMTSGTGDVPLEFGDAFLVSGPPSRVRELSQDPDYIVLGDGSVWAEDVRRAPLAAGLLLLAIVPPLLGWLPLAISAMGCGLLMVATGCLSLGGARRSVDYTILFLIIGTIPLGIALESHGVAGRAADAILFVASYLGEPGLLLSLFGLAAVLSTTSNNGAAAVILAPVAEACAHGGGYDMTKAFLAVAYGASCAFMLPFAHQCNLMVMGPAGYRTRDFVRLGGIMSLLMAVTAVALLAILP